LIIPIVYRFCIQLFSAFRFRGKGKDIFQLKPEMIFYLWRFRHIESLFDLSDIFSYLHSMIGFFELFGSLFPPNENSRYGKSWQIMSSYRAFLT